ncbi:MAG: hypothetical protein SPL30_05160, partial [Succinivibrio sp.]|nr:hypothetical protein [Succinivibrio sp.]
GKELTLADHLMFLLLCFLRRNYTLCQMTLDPHYPLLMANSPIYAKAGDFRVKQTPWLIKWN